MFQILQILPYFILASVCGLKNIFSFCLQSSVQENEHRGDTDDDIGTSSAALTVCTHWQNGGKTSLTQVGFGGG